MAHLLTDEAFALTIGHFRRIGRTDERGYWIAAVVADVHPVEPGDARPGSSLGGADPGPGPVRHRHHLPGGDDRPRGRAHHRPARARRGDRRRRWSAVVVALLAEPVDRDRRAAGIVGPLVGLLVPGQRRDGDGAARHAGVGRALRDAGRPRRRPAGPAATRRRPATRPPDEHRPRPARRPDVRGHLPVPRARPADARASTGCRRSPSTTSSWSARRSSRPSPRSASWSSSTTTACPSFHVGIEWVAVFVCLGDRRLAAQPVPRPGRRGRHRGHRPGGRLAALGLTIGRV